VKPNFKTGESQTPWQLKTSSSLSRETEGRS